MTNDTTSSNESNPVVVWLTTNMPIVSVVVYSIIFLVGTLGNGLVIYVTGCRMKRTVNSVWFLNLALADFLFLVSLLFLIISVSQEYQWPFGHKMCKLITFVSVVNMFASIFLLMAISLDRCLSICVVVWAQNKRTVRKAQLVTASIWVAAMVCSTPYAFFRKLLEVNGKTYCGHVSQAPKSLLITFRFVMGFFIPFLVICFSYVAIGVRARRLQRTRKRRSHRIIASVILAFFICWLPFHVVQFIESKAKPEIQDIIHIAGSLSMCLAFFNSCLNPILYVFMCDEFQKKLKQSVCFVLESALAEDHMSFMSSRSLSSQLSRISRKSGSSSSSDKKGTASSIHLTGCKEATHEERKTLSSD